MSPLSIIQREKLLDDAFSQAVAAITDKNPSDSELLMGILGCACRIVDAEVEYKTDACESVLFAACACPDWHYIGSLLVFFFCV